MNIAVESKNIAKTSAAESKVRMTPSEAFVETLVAQGVKDTFGIVGSAYMDAHDLFPLAGIRFVSVAHEQNAAHMADGWNATGSFEDFVVKRTALYAACHRAGRSESSIEVSSQLFDRGAHADLLEEARRYSRAGVDHLIFVLGPDTTPGELRRLAGQVVEPIKVETN